MGRRFKREGTHVYLIHLDVCQKPSQYCNYSPIKNKIKKKQLLIKKKNLFYSLKKCSSWTNTKPDCLEIQKSYLQTTYLAKTGSSCLPKLISKYTYVNLHNWYFTSS